MEQKTAQRTAERTAALVAAVDAYERAVHDAIARADLTPDPPLDLMAAVDSAAHEVLLAAILWRDSLRPLPGGEELAVRRLVDEPSDRYERIVRVLASEAVRSGVADPEAATRLAREALRLVSAELATDSSKLVAAVRELHVAEGLAERAAEEEDRELEASSRLNSALDKIVDVAVAFVDATTSVTDPRPIAPVVDLEGRRGRKR